MFKKIKIRVNEKNQPLGETRRNTRWSEAIVEQIRALWNEGKGIGYRRISKKLGIPVGTVAHICYGRTRDAHKVGVRWKNVIDNRRDDTLP